MASAPVIIDRASSAHTAVQDINQYDIISADSEGVHLGKEGPLTLLQIGCPNGQVYLFDIHSGGREMFTDGGLKDLLESPRILKVMHGASNDSGALHCQFGVDLKNVFDIQTAQMLYDRHQGRQLPSRMKLPELCRLYLTDVSDLDQKDEIQLKWDKTEGEYWATRPLTLEMINYASSDILLLIPVYRKLYSLLKSSCQLEEFRNEVDIDLRCRWDDVAKDEDTKRMKDVIASIFRDMEEKYSDTTDIAAVTDEDELQALKRTHVRELDTVTPTIRALKFQLLEKEIEEIRDELQEKKSDFIPRPLTFNILLSARDHPKGSVKDLAEVLKTRCTNIQKTDMANKYTMTTPLVHTTASEHYMLRGLRPKSQTDGDFHKVVLRLYWLLMEKELGNEIARFEQDKGGYEIREGYMGKVRFYFSAPGIPLGIKNKAKTFLQDPVIVRKMPRPNRGRGRGRRY